MEAVKKQIPKHRVEIFSNKANKYCICIPVINEGNRIIGQLTKIKNLELDQIVDIIICDGGSTDGSMEVERLKSLGVRTLLVKEDTGKLSAQLRMGYAYALEEGYEGILTIDGNGKDSVEDITKFVEALDQGWDLVQGSRYAPGGKAINTPKLRHFAVKLLHVPIVSAVARFKYTDTTNGYRAYSRRYLTDDRVQPFRKIFDTYELLAYLSVRAPQLGYNAKEVGVTRAYPDKGEIPTKISFLKGNSKLLKILWGLIIREYDPKV
ncbi:glycosyltransferase family 2 protein [Litchfieldia alkalitelluris]|uniref:glycosyltransferase family 2 protein n=1 Tax=Litchfieldia alkalitelluris TaxID=304268 RepID=UPI0009977082|nr:glycosyltransferase family 2 protein [Litchfieldia alkalitelluris]